MSKGLNQHKFRRGRPLFCIFKERWQEAAVNIIKEKSPKRTKTTVFQKLTVNDLINDVILSQTNIF